MTDIIYLPLQLGYIEGEHLPTYFVFHLAFVKIALCLAHRNLEHVWNIYGQGLKHQCKLMQTFGDNKSLQQVSKHILQELQENDHTQLNLAIFDFC